MAFGSAIRVVLALALSERDSASFQHLGQGLGIGQTVIIPDLDQSRGWKPAVFDKLLRIGEWNHIVSPAV